MVRVKSEDGEHLLDFLARVRDHLGLRLHRGRAPCQVRRPGFRVQDLWFRIWGLGFRVLGVGFALAADTPGRRLS